MIQEIKDHVKKHKIAYSCGGTAVVTAGITCLIMKGRYEVARGEAYGLETADTSVTVRSFFNFSSKDSGNISTVIHRGGTGSPSYIIECDEIPNVAWLSQRAMSFDTGISETTLSKHLSGKLPDAEGLHCRRIGVAVA
jgi:hypothetical protein